MIAHLIGKIILRTDKTVVISAGGIGYKVNVAADTLLKIAGKEEIGLWTHLVVREDSLELFGFLKEEELRFFENLIGVSGVGPKTALGIIGLAPIQTMKKAIATGDLPYLTKVSGIGKKTAEKIVLELRDKLGSAEGPELKTAADALSALVSLGYSREEAREALKKVKSETTEEKIKEALKNLAEN
jgi:Holliday junction DNA helicase RuvA